MGQYTIGDKLRMSAWTILLRALLLVAVVGMSLVPGVSVMGALLLVLSLLVVKNLLMIWFPAERRRRASGPPGHPSGDRFPRRPLRPTSSLAADAPDSYPG